VIELLASALKALAETDASALLLRIQSEIWPLVDRIYQHGVCSYAWGHGFFSRYVTRKVHERYERTDFVLDTPGLAAAYGCIKFLKEFEEGLPGQWSPYYKGYLLLCATNDLQHTEIEARGQGPDFICERKALVAKWLVEYGADVLTPQLRPSSSVPDALMVRPPIVQCWIFVVKLLKHHNQHCLSFLNTVHELMRYLSRHTCLDEEKYIWSVGPADCEHDFETKLHEGCDVAFFDVAFFAQSELRSLRAFAWSLQESREGGTVPTP